MKLKLIDEDWLDKMISKCENTLSLTTEALAGNTSKFLLLKHIKEQQLKSPKEEIEKAIEYGLWSYQEFDRNSNYDKESREEGLKEIQEQYLKDNNYE